MNRAKVRVSFDFLKDAFLFPEDTTILGVHMDLPMQFNHEFEIWLEHPDLVEIQDGEAVPTVCPTYRSRAIPAFLDWGWIE